VAEAACDARWEFMGHSFVQRSFHAVPDQREVIRTDGTPMQGYLTPPGRGDPSLGTLQPVIVTAQGQVFFWCGDTPGECSASR
jgi:hypothetical protein